MKEKDGGHDREFLLITGYLCWTVAVVQIFIDQANEWFNGFCNEIEQEQDVFSCVSCKKAPLLFRFYFLSLC